MSLESGVDPKEKFEEFFKSFKDEKEELKYRRKIQQLSIENKISIIVDFDDLLKYDAELSRELLTKPEEIIKAADQAALTVLELEDREYFEKLKNEDKKLFVRFRNLPSINHIPLRKIRSEHIGLLVMVDGILTRASEVKPRLVEAAFECLRCHYINFVKQETTEIVKPIVCENVNCRRNGPFRLVNEESKFEDWQKIRIQEKPEELPPGQLPRAIDAILTYDLVDAARPGDRVSVIGILRSTPEYSGRTKLSTFKIYLEANYIDITEKELEKTEITPEDEQRILELSRDPNIHSKIISSIAPSIYGLEDVKEAIALQLFGGVSKVLPDSMKIRGESNILLVGDPGTAKCVAPGVLVLTASGEKRKIEEIVEEQLEKNIQVIDDGYYAHGSIKVYTMNKMGRIEQAEANIFWKRRAPPYTVKIKTESGKEITVTPTHLFFTTDNGLILYKKASELSINDYIATPKLEKLQLNESNQKLHNEKNTNIIPGLKDLLKKIREERSLNQYQMGVPESIYRKYESGELEANVKDLQVIIENAKKYGISENLARLIAIVEADVIWDKVTAIELQKTSFKWVYDLQVPGSNNFVANEFYVHNSQLLQYTAQLAPRGLYTSGKGSSAAGLCVAPDTLIIKDDAPCEIGKLVDEHLREGGVKIQEGVYKVNPKKELKIKTINSVKTADKKINWLWKIKSPEILVRIVTSTGREVILTPETKMKTLQGEYAYWKKASELTENDQIAAVKRISYTGRKVNILEVIGSVEGLEASVKKTFLKKLLEKLNSKTYGEPVKEWFKINLNNEENELNTVRINLRELIEYVNKAGYSLHDLASNIEEYWESDKTKVKLPCYLTSDLMYLIGLYAGSLIYNKNEADSNELKFKTKSIKLAKLFNKIAEETLNLRFKYSKRSGELIELTLNNKILRELIYKTCLDNSDEKRLDLTELTFTLEEKELAGFISGLFDYSANIPTKNGEDAKISFNIPGKKLACKLQLALLRYGVISELTIADENIKNERRKACELYTLTITGLNLLNFYEKIGLKFQDNVRKLETLIETVKEEYNLSLETSKTLNNPEPNKKMFSTKKVETENLEKISLEENITEYLNCIENDIFWDKIQTIEFLTGHNYEWLYDVTVEDSHSFIANGLLVHNTAAVLKDESGAMALEAGALVLADKGLACLHPDTKIVFNGKPTAISSLFNSAFKADAVSKGEIVEVAPLNGYVISLDLDRLKLFENKTDIIRRKWYRGEILTLIFKSGFKITLTPDHNIIKGEVLNWREAACFKPGDSVLTAPKKLLQYIQSTGLKGEFKNQIKSSQPVTDLNTNILKTANAAYEYNQDTVVSIEKQYYEGWVYDLHVEKYHNFLAEGIWVHNCIDEFDKMNPQDRVAIHEAMEQRTVSIAKAGIIATLNARTSILAAANPALGRYNEYRSPADNIKLPVTLLSRFDLIFIVTDKPDAEKDRKIAEHILSLHRRESVEPPLDIDFLRKYITYAKRNCSPTISLEAAKKIEEFYLEMRKAGEGADSPVPITARQLEALIRLVEARARMALKKEATVDDAEAVIRLVKNCLRQVGVDRETGKMDIDMIMTGAPKSQRDRLTTLLDVIATLEKEHKGPVQVQDIIDRAKEYQLEEGFVKEALQRLLNDGTIFEPEPGYIKRTE